MFIFCPWPSVLLVLRPLGLHGGKTISYPGFQLVDSRLLLLSLHNSDPVRHDKPFYISKYTLLILFLQRILTNTERSQFFKVKRLIGVYLNTDLFEFEAHLVKLHFLRTLHTRNSAKHGDAVTNQTDGIPDLIELLVLLFL